jgi:hypothetical protein
MLTATVVDRTTRPISALAAKKVAPVQLPCASR